MQFQKTARRSTAPASSGRRHQRTQGVVKVSARGVQTVYPTGPKSKAPASSNKKITPDTAVKKQRTGPKNTNNGWTPKTKCSAKTTVLMLDMQPLIDRAQRKDVHVTYFVGKYAPGMEVSAADFHANLKYVLKILRKDVGEELAYIWDVERMPDGQPHVNIVTALTDREAYVLRTAWRSICGDPKALLSEVAHITTPSAYEEATRSAEELIENALNYIMLFGGSDKAVEKAEQYWSPKGWTETGTGAMWGRSRNLKPAEEVSLVVHNMRQRVAVDRYMSRRLNIPANTVVWVYEDGTTSDPYNTSAFSPDRWGGSRRTVRMTAEMVRDLHALIKYFA
jgi:hypothetical protein